METLSSEKMYKLMDDELANYLGWTLQLNQKTAELEAAEKDAKFLLASLIESAYAEGKIEGKNAEERSRRETIWLHGQEQYDLINAELDALRAVITELKVQIDVSAQRLRILHNIAGLRASELRAISKDV